MKRVNVEIAHAELPDLLGICRRLRERDEREIRGIWRDVTPQKLADAAMASLYAKVAKFNGRPVAAFGTWPLGQDVWTVWLFGTKHFNRVGRAVSLHVKRDMIPFLLDAGMARAECKALADCGTEPWLRRMGGILESEAALGANGEIYRTYRWLRQELEG